MLDRLIESRKRRDNSHGASVASVAAHTVVIGVALYATAQARVEPPRPAEIVHLAFPAPTHQSASLSTTKPLRAAIRTQQMIFVEPRLDLHLPPVEAPPIDNHAPVLVPGEGTVFATPPGSGAAGLGSGNDPYRAEDVEKPVILVPGTEAPHYPESLRLAGIEGQVIAVFVVDESGRVEQESIRFVRSDNVLFEREVKLALLRMRFVAAEIGGRKVRQLVQAPFVFTLKP
ncbi:MAG: TonB family protein [Gemmatimonadaceae bacterium]